MSCFFPVLSAILGALQGSLHNVASLAEPHRWIALALTVPYKLFLQSLLIHKEGT